MKKTDSKIKYKYFELIKKIKKYFLLNFLFRNMRNWQTTK